jgi:hypothetical protein
MSPVAPPVLPAAEACLVDFHDMIRYVVTSKRLEAGTKLCAGAAAVATLAVCLLLRRPHG